MYSTNEWNDLQEVIVGVADYATIPNIDRSLRLVNYSNLEHTNQVATGLYPQQVIHEANEDLDIFCDFLTKAGIKVHRPRREPCTYYNYCPRDLVVAFKDLALASPMCLRARKHNYKHIEHLFHNLTVAHFDQPDELYNDGAVKNPDIYALTEHEPSFDAANILRADDHLLYLISNSGNHKGAQYLQEQVGTNAKVVTVEGIYSYMHIDSTIAFLREGLMLINPSRIKDMSILPKPFCDWDYIVCPEPHDIGYYPGYCNASPWIGMNLFSVNPNLVVLEKHQTALAKELNKHNIECELLPMRHSRTMSGSFHCVTLDLSRK